MNRKIRFLGIGITVAVLIADQVSMHLILKYFLPDGVETHGVLALAPFFNLRLVWNYGVSFGMLANGGNVMPYVLMAVAFGMVAFLAHWLSRTERRSVAFGIGLVAGGALGNVIDRVRYGAVVDFLDFHWQNWHYPAFNIADSAIVVGALWLMLDSFRKRPEADAAA